MAEEVVEPLVELLFWPGDIEFGRGLEEQELGLEPLLLLARKQEYFAQSLFLPVIGRDDRTAEQVQDQKVAPYHEQDEEQSRSRRVATLWLQVNPSRRA